MYVIVYNNCLPVSNSSCTDNVAICSCKRLYFDLKTLHDGEILKRTVLFSD